MGEERVVIGIFGQLSREEDPQRPADPARLNVVADYPRSISQAGGVPIVFGPSDDLSAVQTQLALCDGVLYTGGSDLDPALYGESVLEKCQTIDPRRDAYERAGMEVVEALGLPLFGICRGMQFINCYYGGSLYQDLSYAGIKTKHVQEGFFSWPIHGVHYTEGSFFAQVIGRQEMRVNSYHHQLIHRLADGFQAVGRADDGVIEAIQREKGPFMAGVQFHPEIMSRNDPASQAIFKGFIACCEKSKAGRREK